ncbi:MAG: ABC transporter substrate-binding protein [Deltaproteobacteria bacterium]|nr:ABC transporter substrate-binding protein [Deltaproteobacteria bacterium]MDZ4347212.1 ABC transporter substrate-binding protein [Candidatus Binatia bacterium]
MKNIFTLVAVIAALFGYRAIAETQQRGKIPKLGILEPGSSSVCTAGFLPGLRELGYVDGQNIVIESRSGESKPERLREVAADLVRSAPDLIWTHSIPAILAAKQATTTIPIVAGVSRDMVELGIVASLARPGGNITGMELRDNEILGKRLEILKETVPKASRVAVLVNSNDPTHAIIPKNIEPEARALKVLLQRVEASAFEVFDKAFADMVQGRAHALLIPENAMFSQNRQRILELAISKRLPSAAGGSHFADAGSLLSYGANVRDLCRRSATLVDKILKGRKPTELPVERADKFEFVVNLKTAKQIGVTVPPNVLVRATRVVK